MKKNLVLLGLMAVGKTTLGKIVARKLELEFVDTDANIEKKNSMSVKDIFKKKGEKFFRFEEEKQVLKSLKKDGCVIALGGGAFINKTIRENILKNAISIWLDVNLKTLEKRVGWNNKRPLLNKKNTLTTLEKFYLKRKNIYKMANYRIVCNKMNKENISKKIIELYEKK